MRPMTLCCVPIFAQAEQQLDVAVIGGGPGGLAAAKAILTARCGPLPPPLPRHRRPPLASPPLPLVDSKLLSIPPLLFPSQPCRPELRVGVFERASLRPRGASLGVQPNGIRALEAIHPDMAEAVLGIDCNPGTRRCAGCCMSAIMMCGLLQPLLLPLLLPLLPASAPALLPLPPSAPALLLVSLTPACHPSATPTLHHCAGCLPGMERW
jgi:hypothetical protein